MFPHAERKYRRTPATRRAARALLLGAGLTLVMAMNFGCEERVVKVENSWIGSQYGRIEEERRERERQNWSLGKEIDKSIQGTERAIGNTGNALFGWTGGVGRGIGNLFGDDGKPAQTTHRSGPGAPASPMHERMMQQTTTSSAGSSSN
ncbi:MAG: hypothetical protein GC159_01050 [Phycisphaera sp.]|nr:hypothetical protein [Phycisphaera sp.]